MQVMMMMQICIYVVAQQCVFITYEYTLQGVNYAYLTSGNRSCDIKPSFDGCGGKILLSQCHYETYRHVYSNAWRWYDYRLAAAWLVPVLQSGLQEVLYKIRFRCLASRFRQLRGFHHYLIVRRGVGSGGTLRNTHARGAGWHFLVILHRVMGCDNKWFVRKAFPKMPLQLWVTWISHTGRVATPCKWLLMNINIMLVN